MIRDIAGVIVRVIRAVMPVVKALINGIKVVISEIGSNAGRFFRFIAGAVKSFYETIVKPIVNALTTWFERFRQFLQKVFGPVLKAFEWINTWLDRIWDKVIGPILEVIDRIRLIFKLLGELGFGWAQSIERLLERIQTEIYNAFLEVRTWVNTVTNWFDLLLDPRGWIRSTPFLMTIWKFGGNVLNIITTLGGIDQHGRARLEVWGQDHQHTPMLRAVEKFKAGELRDDPGITIAAARFRSRQTPEL